MPAKLTKKEVLERFQKVHTNKYDYSNFQKYNHSHQKIKIICQKHGEFVQSISNHLKGHGCPKCSQTHQYSNKEYIQKAKKVHNNFYSYHKTNYINKKTKVIITCPIHGDFLQSPYEHICGHGCPVCANNKKKTFNQFLKEASIIHNNKYNYLVPNNFHNSQKICIICPEHGEFWQTPKDHLNKHGCPICAINQRKDKKMISQKEFLVKANEAHPNQLFDYSKSQYQGTHNKVCIICPEHGEFWQTPHNHISMKHGCPKCQHIISSYEKDLLNFIKKHYSGKIITNERSILSNNKELDIYLPDLKLAFEFNGLYWHSELYTNKNSHLNKTKECESKGIHLIHIYEDDWVYKQKIVKSRILNLLGCSEKIYARKTIIKEVTYKASKIFLEKNHLQGNCMSKIRIGLYFQKELVALMTFGKLRKNLGQTHHEKSFELLRFCNKINTTVVGGANKLFKYFISNFNPKQIISYADRSWTMNNNNNLYNRLNFKQVKVTLPNYHYIVNKTRKNRFLFRKDCLIKQGFDSAKTEHQIMFEQNIFRIYNSGNIKFVYSK